MNFSYNAAHSDPHRGADRALINQVTKYLKWPLEKLFRDLRDLHPPTLADSEKGSLVCDSITRIIRPGWARNTNGKWLVVINTAYHIQTVTEIKCRSEGTACAFIAPCFHSSCQQRYNIQSLLVIDPNNHYKGPFVSHFLFPSSCVCFVPDPKLVVQSQCQAASKYGS
ncbi:protein spaetzle 4-like [Galendromus occidentalis]|uniref:Protein spaetzle 4-like n=1 Tax=Galendromus occidentalis TaxID=34638 RepID=A0AAJ6QQD0_9ACAR|nr:protein spaetzle 4-like [Galendromus occidentalis]